MRSNASRVALTVLVGAALLAGGTTCSRRGSSDIATSSEAMSVDVATLWEKDAATDPVTAYKVRLATEPRNAGLHNNLGNAYVLANDLENAVREYKTAAEIDRRSPIPWNNLGTAYRKMGKTGRAMDAFKKAIKVDAGYALAHYNLGTLYDDAGNYDKAIEAYLTAVSLKPELIESTNNPQIVNNRNLMVLKLRHFLEEEGNVALPLDRLPE